VCKPPPTPLLGQHLEQQIDGMRRGQQHQQMQPPQLGGAEIPLSASSRPVRPLLAQKIIRDEGREFVEQGVGASNGK
jgi:hypothetical protein